MSSLLQEINHYPKESVYNHFFRICFPDDVFYDKITRKQMVVQMRAQKYGLDLRSLETKPLFNFWTYYTFDYLMPDDTDGEAIVYYDSIPYMAVIANARLDYELIAPEFLKPESYLSIFYNGYDDTDPDVHALFDHFKKSEDVFDSFKMERILECIETCRMTEHLIAFFPKLEEFDPRTTELFKNAIYKMPMPYLTGMTLQYYQSKMKR